MFFEGLMPQEVVFMEAFIKSKVREIAVAFYKESENGLIKKAEVPYLVRYFLQFPSDNQVVEEIIPEIEKIEADVDKSSDMVQIEAFEKQLLIILKTNLYPISEKEVLLECFKLIDIEKKGFIDLHTYYTFLKSYGVSFNKKQIKDLEDFLKENESDFFDPLKIDKETSQKKKHNQYTTRNFYYESYVRKVVMDNKSHFDELKEEFRIFIDAFKETLKQNKI
jgi:Ca2+-binding EF-hand superfamily protein